MTSLLSSLNEAQREIASTFYGPILVLAGAGSGKTRALTHRIAHMLEEKVAAPEEILAVTFTNKAAKEMKERVGSLLSPTYKVPAFIGTFHSLGVKILRETPLHHARSKEFVIVDEKDSERVLKEAMQKAVISIKQISLRTARSRISLAKNSLQTPDTLAASDSPMDKDIARIFHFYEHILAQHKAYDFDDLLLVPLRLLQDHSDLRDAYQRRWRFLSVDEYQDTNPVQESLLRLLTGPEKNVCVVGDDYQAIYSWRGANVDHILHFEKSYPSCKVIYLTQNYRSTPDILAAANEVIASNIHQKHKQLWTQEPAGKPITLTRLQSETHEARYVQEQILRHQAQGGSLKDCVVLYRTNAQSRVFEEEFLTHRIPYTIVGGYRFYDRKEIKDALALLTLAVNPSSIIAFRRLAESYLQGVGPKTIRTISDEALATNTSILDVLRAYGARKASIQAFCQVFSADSLATHGETVTSLLSYLLKASGYLSHIKTEPDGQERMENIQELLNVTSVYSDPSAFLEEVALLSDLDSIKEEADRVTCMTTHAAKGLEFPVVFLTGLEEGILPHVNSLSSNTDIEEERRLMYVGMTRAQHQLFLSYAQSRFVHRESHMQLPSRFLKDLPDGIHQENDRVIVPLSKPVSSSFLDPLVYEPFHQDTSYESDEAASVFKVNDLVRHTQFGRGVIIDIQETALVCVFEGHGIQSIKHSEAIKQA